MKSNTSRLRGRFGGFAVRTITGFALLAACTLGGWAQETTGQIEGTVTDATGAIVPGATLSAVSPRTPKPIEAISDEKGAYILPSLPIGEYTVTVTKQGFSKLVQRGISVRLGSKVTFSA